MSGTSEPMPTSTTPGSARISSAISPKRCLAAASTVESVARNGTGIVKTSSVRRPVLTADSSIIVRVSRPAPASNTTDTAIWATTSPRCSRCLPGVPVSRFGPAETSAPWSVLARQRCREREEQRDRDREPECEPEHRAIELDLGGARRVPGDEADQQLESAERDDETQRGPYQREQEILDQQQPPQPTIPGAERGPHHQLVTSSHTPASA